MEQDKSVMEQICGTLKETFGDAAVQQFNAEVRLRKATLAGRIIEARKFMGCSCGVEDFDKYYDMDIPELELLDANHAEWSHRHACKNGML